MFADWLSLFFFSNTCYCPISFSNFFFLLFLLLFWKSPYHFVNQIKTHLSLSQWFPRLVFFFLNNDIVMFFFFESHFTNQSFFFFFLTVLRLWSFLQGCSSSAEFHHPQHSQVVSIRLQYIFKFIE